MTTSLGSKPWASLRKLLYATTTPGSLSCVRTTPRKDRSKWSPALGDRYREGKLVDRNSCLTVNFWWPGECASSHHLSGDTAIRWRNVPAGIQRDHQSCSHHFANVASHVFILETGLLYFSGCCEGALVHGPKRAVGRANSDVLAEGCAGQEQISCAEYWIQWNIVSR